MSTTTLKEFNDFCLSALTEENTKIESGEFSWTVSNQLFPYNLKCALKIAKRITEDDWRSIFNFYDVKNYGLRANVLTANNLTYLLINRYGSDEDRDDGGLNDFIQSQN